MKVSMDLAKGPDNAGDETSAQTSKPTKAANRATLFAMQMLNHPLGLVVDAASKSAEDAGRGAGSEAATTFRNGGV